MSPLEENWRLYSADARNARANRNKKTVRNNKDFVLKKTNREAVNDYCEEDYTWQFTNGNLPTSARLQSLHPLRLK